MYRHTVGVRACQRRVRRAPRGALRLVFGAANTHYGGWIATQQEILDLCSSGSFERILDGRLADAFLAEHVWEHLTGDEGVVAASNCFRHMQPGARLRIAVPDGYSTVPGYIDSVRPGGTGLGSEDHKVLYNYVSLSRSLESVGFSVHLLEYFDEAGEFVANAWDPSDGYVARSLQHDPRNRDGIHYTSLIVDAVKVA